jgi:hypothetical protein
MNKYNVVKFQAPFERMKDYNLNPEVRLYKSIIIQAIIDASNISEDSCAKKIELDAKAWLFGESKDFQEACFRADFEPCYVIKIAKKIIRLNCLNNKCNELKVA